MEGKESKKGVREFFYKYYAINSYSYEGCDP